MSDLTVSLPRRLPSGGRAWLWLLPLLALVLFPYGWLANAWPLFDRFVEQVFRTEVAHVLGHLGSFFGLGLLLLQLWPRLAARPWLFFPLLLSLGMMQELLQLLSFKHRFVTGADLFDLIVDLAGAALALHVWRRLAQEESYAAS